MFASLQAAVDELDRIDPAELPSAALGENIVELLRLADRIRVQAARQVRVFHARRVCVEEGAANTTQWLRLRCRMMPSSAANMVAVATQLGELPRVERAARDGEIGFDHAAVIARTSEWVGRDAIDRVEGAFLDAAMQLDPARLAVAGRWFRAHVDPDRYRLDHERAYEMRGLSMSRCGDWYFLDGQLDLEGGAVVERALQKLMGPREEARTPRQRRADALVELATGARPPQLVVVADGRLEKGEIEGAGPVPRETLERIACDASITDFWVDESGKLNAGRTRRSWNPATRRAMVARDRHCRFPGCDRSTSWCEGHHLVPWAAGGATRADQGVLLCRFHHRIVHARGLTVSFAGAQVVFAPP